MNKLADKIVAIIRDYRKDTGVLIDRTHVLKWVNQFQTKHREFLLAEMSVLLPKSYVSKPRARRVLRNLIELLTKNEGYKSVQSFLSHVKFLDCQPKGKSQSEILDLVDEYLIRRYDLNVDSCGTKPVKYLIYLDDILATGGTFVKDIVGLTEKGEDLMASGKIIRFFFFVHSWGEANSSYRLRQSVDVSVVDKMELYQLYSIENNPRINVYNPNPVFNHCYPTLQARYKEQWMSYLDELDDANRNSKFAFRNPKFPMIEKFYSSPKSRIKYETILLNMGIRILADVNEIGRSARPLGFTIPSNQTFGTGGHAFTWRNVSNTCPLVFWWEVNGWYPLFSVQNRGI
jgi:hypothetical protein